MTLITSIIGKNKVVQVSDTRLTLRGQETDADAIKAVCVGCNDARFSIGYSGVGEIEGQRTDYWLVDQVNSIFDSGRYGVKAIMWELAVAAENAMPRLRYGGLPVRRQDRWLQLELVGYHHSEEGPFSRPFSITIANTRSRGVGVPYGVESEFIIKPSMLKPGLPDNETYGIMIGATAAILAEDEHAKENLKSLNQVLRQLRRVDLGQQPSGRTTAERLVWVMREASKHPKYGKYIGRNFLSVVIHPDSPAMATYYHPSEAVALERGPHLVTPELTMTDLEFDVDLEAPEDSSRS